MAKKNHDKSPEVPEENLPNPEEAASASANEEPVSDGAAAEVAELEEALKAEKDKYLRLLAEYDNFRKRSQKEREALFNDVRSDTISKLLPVYDNLARALQQETTDEAFYKGVEMTMTQLKSILEKLGVTEIPAVGEVFDPARHNAVMHIEDESCGENVIVEEFEKGFMLGDKVIRFSMVKVAN